MPRHFLGRGTDRKLQTMSDPLHLDKIRAGAPVWNKWRRDNPGVVPDLNGLRISASELQFGAVQGGPVDFSRAELCQAVLVHATLIEANLAGAMLIKADLSYGRLNKADLRGADLRGAKLGYADLTEARLDGAFVCGADLRHARGLTQQQIDRAFGGESTLLPAGLHVPATWLAEEERERQRGDGQGIDSPISEYDLLGVKPKASMQEIRTAWLRLVKELHPDIAADDPSANERLKAINRAYQGLKADQRDMARMAERRPSSGAATFAVFLFLPIAATIAMALWTHGLPLALLSDAPVAAVTEQQITELRTERTGADDAALAEGMGQTREAQPDQARASVALRYPPNEPAFTVEIGVLPTSTPEHADTAAADDAAWAQAAAEATTVSLHRYLARFPQGRHAQKATSELTQLAAVEIALGQAGAARAATQRTEPTLRRYLVEHPTGQLSDEARRKLSALEAEARADVAWSGAERKDAGAAQAKDVAAKDVAAHVSADTSAQSTRQEVALADTAEQTATRDPVAGADVPRINAEHAEQADFYSHLEPRLNGRHAEPNLTGLESILEAKPAAAAANTRHTKQVFRTGRPGASSTARSTSEPFVGADGRIR